MLKDCPECENKVSDKALFCPKCGFPFKTRKKESKAKKLRLPNGFGRITKISNKNLRNPYRVMVTVGTDETGKPVGRILKPTGYFSSYNDAYAALMEYHKNPFDLNKSLTVEELYEKWRDSHFKTVSDSRIRSYRSAFNFCSSLYNVEVRSLRASQIKMVIEDGVKIDKDGNEIRVPINIKPVIKSMFSQMLDFALERDFIDKNVAKDVKMTKEDTKAIEDAKTSHIPFTHDELDVLWANEENSLVVSNILIQCYSGWRPGELIDLKLSDVDLTEWTFTGGNKTENGKNRTVPIHTKIRPIVKKLYDLAGANGINSLALLSINKNIAAANETSYKRGIKRVLKSLNLNMAHRPHDGRVTFVTLAKEAGVDEYAIKRLVGHSISDLTEKIYTVRNIDWLRSEIEKIK